MPLDARIVSLWGDHWTYTTNSSVWESLEVLSPTQHTQHRLAYFHSHLHAFIVTSITSWQYIQYMWHLSNICPVKTSTNSWHGHIQQKSRHILFIFVRHLIYYLAFIGTIIKIKTSSVVTDRPNYIPLGQISGHSRLLLKVIDNAPLSMAHVGSYQYSIVTMPLSCTFRRDVQYRIMACSWNIG